MLDNEEEKAMRFLEIEKQHLVDTRELILFAKLQLLMMNDHYKMHDAPGFLRRCPSLIDAVIKEKLTEGSIGGLGGGI